MRKEITAVLLLGFKVHYISTVRKVYGLARLSGPSAETIASTCNNLVIPLQDLGLETPLISVITATKWQEAFYLFR